MTAIAAPARLSFVSAIGVRQVRLTCGLIMFSYVLSHFANHALGNVSYLAMESWLEYHMRWWRIPVVAAVLYTAAITHWSLGLWALYERREFRYKVPEVTQLVLGLSIPVLIVIHIVGVRLQSPLFGRNLYYAQARVGRATSSAWPVATSCSRLNDHSGSNIASTSAVVRTVQP